MKYLKILISFLLIFNLANVAAQVDKSQNKAIKYSNKADILLSKGKFEKSIAVYTKSIELQPLKSAHYYRRGIAYQSNKNYQKAYADFDKTVQIDTTSTKGYYQRGLMQLKLKNYNEAIADFKLHEAIVGANAESAIQSGKAAMALKKYDEAINYLESAEKLKANDFGIYQLKAEIYMKLEDYAAAETEIAVLRTINGGNNQIDLMEALCAIERKNSIKAKTILNKLIRTNPNAVAYNLLSTAYSIESNQDSALYFINKAIELKPMAEYYFNRGTYSALKNDTINALKDFNATLKLNRKFVEALNHRTFYIWIPQGKYKNALKDMNTLIQTDSSNAFAYNNRSYAYFKLNDLDNAFVDAYYSLNVKMKNSYAFRNLAVYYSSVGEEVMSREMVTFTLVNNYSIKQDPEFQAVLNGLGIIY